MTSQQSDLFASRAPSRVSRCGRFRSTVLVALAILMVLSGVLPESSASAQNGDVEWLSVSPLPAVRLNVALSGGTGIPLQVSGGSEPYTIVVTSGSLPSGLSLTGTTITGTPTATGTASFTLTATDANGDAAERAFELSVVRGKRTVALEATQGVGTPGSPIVLGTLASRTQANNTNTTSAVIPNPLTRGWVNISGSGPYTITGVDSRTNLPYSFQTDFNYASTREQWRKEGDERPLVTPGDQWFQSSTTNPGFGAPPSGQTARRLESRGWCSTGLNASYNSYCSMFGPEVWTEPFVADQGESLSFAWAAQGGGDDYESYAFLVKVASAATSLSTARADTNAHTLLAYGRGGTQGWTIASGEIPADGTYRFRFVNGSYDRTGGGLLGAAMFVDPVITIGSTQTITFPEIGPQTTATGALNVLNLAGVVTASSGLAVTLTASGVCTVSGLSVTLTNGGTCTLTANQQGSDLFVPAASVTRSFTVTLRTAQDPVIATVSHTSVVYGDTITVTASGGSGTGAFSISLSQLESCTLSGATITATAGTGACAVVVTKAGDATYAQRSSDPVVITVSPRPLTVTGVSAVNRPFVDGNATVTLQGATLNGVLAGDSVGLAGATTGTAASDQPGTHAVTTSMTLTGPAAANYSVTQPTGLTVKILALQAAVAVALSQTSAVYGDTIDVTPSGGTGDGALTVQLVQSDSCTLDGATITITSGTGDCAVTATRAGDDTYATAVSPATSITVAPRPVTVFGPTALIRSFNGATDVTLPACSQFEAQNLIETDVAGLTLVCPSSGTTASQAVGTHAVSMANPFTLSGANAANYTVAQPAFTLTITRAQAQIWFSGGLVQLLQANGSGVGLPQVAANPSDAGTLIVDWHDVAPPTAPGRYRVNLTLDSATHQATPVATFVSVLAVQSLPQNMPAPAIGPVMARTEDGEPVVPVKPPSEVTVKRDDQPVNVTVTRPTPTQVKIEEDNGQSAILFATRTTRTTDERPLAAETDLVLLAGGVLDVSGSGYQHGTTVEVWMFSEPELLGVTTVAPDGTFTDQFDVPANVAAGEHVIQLNGTTATGQLGSASIGVLVEVPASNDDPSPLRVGTGPLLRATSRGPAGIVGTTPVAMRTDVARARSVLGRGQDTLVVARDGQTDGFAARLTPHANGGAGAVTANSVVLSRDAYVEGTVDGFAPFTSVHLWLLSEPRLLGRVITNQDGEAVFRLTLPDDAPYGRHSVQFVGTTTRGQTAGFAVGAWVVPDVPVFADVAFDVTHGAAITTLGASGHVHGFADGTFKPQATITRGHAATMIANLFEFDTVDVTGMFSDTAGTTHQAAIAALAAAGVADGFADGTFKPSAAITRGQAAMLLARVLDLDLSEGQTGNGFSDVAGRTDAAAINVLHERGFVTGFADGTFKPDASITRGQFASMLVQAHYLSQAR